MHTDVIDLTAFDGAHLEGALRLSRQAGWPHRSEDWAMALALSQGVVAVEAGGQVVGTILVTPYGPDCATINMVLVDAALRGRGLGRRLMKTAVDSAGHRALRLVATAEGLPLYEKLGFEATGQVLQLQGTAQAVTASNGVLMAEAADLPAIAALDALAFGADRRDLIAYIARAGEFAVIRRRGQVAGFAARRVFGRGEVIGPVVAAHAGDAKDLISYFAAARAGRFLRLDTRADTDLAPWLAGLGLSQVGDGVAMVKPAARPESRAAVKTFALANQAFG